MNLKKVLLFTSGLILCMFSAVHFADTQNRLTENKLKNILKDVKIRSVSLAELPNTSAILMMINTSKGQQKVIVAKNRVEPTLKMLGVNNTTIVPVANHAKSLSLANNQAEKSSISSITTPKSMAAAMMTSTVVSANQQASR